MGSTYLSLTPQPNSLLCADSELYDPRPGKDLGVISLPQGTKTLVVPPSLLVSGCSWHLYSEPKSRRQKRRTKIAKSQGVVKLSSWSYQNSFPIWVLSQWIVLCSLVTICVFSHFAFCPQLYFLIICVLSQFVLSHNLCFLKMCVHRIFIILVLSQLKFCKNFSFFSFNCHYWSFVTMGV